MRQPPFTFRVQKCRSTGERLTLHDELRPRRAREAFVTLRDWPGVLTPGSALILRSEQTGEVCRVVLDTRGIL